MKVSDIQAMTPDQLEDELLKLKKEPRLSLPQADLGLPRMILPRRHSVSIWGTNLLLTKMFWPISKNYSKNISAHPFRM